MPRIGTPDDAAKSIINLIRGMGGDHISTRGGRRTGAGGGKKSAVKKKKRSNTVSFGGDEDSGGGTTDGGGTFTSPMSAAWSMIRGGIGGSMVELPIGPEGTILASIGGQLVWAYPTSLGVPVSYLTFMDGVTEYDVTDASDVALWA